MHTLGRIGRYNTATRTGQADAIARAVTIWVGERVRPHDPLPAPSADETIELNAKRVVPMRRLLEMKLTANRDHDRTHLRDLIGVGLVDRSMLEGPPEPLRERLGALLGEAGL